MTRTILFLGLALLLAAAATAVAQTQAPPAGAGASPQSAVPPQQSAPPIVVRTPVVIVPVTVKDSHGQLVDDLKSDDFRILADNIEQKTATFSSEAVPISAVVLLDNDLDQRVSSRVQKSLAAIAAGFGPSDEVALVAYDELPQTVSDFSYNNDALFTTLTRFEISSHDRTVYTDPAMPTGAPTPGTTPPPGVIPAVNDSGTRLYLPQKFHSTVALNDAIFAAGQMLRDRGRDRRKIIFLISDQSDSGNNAHGFEETLRSLLISDVSVYSISVAHAVPIGKKLVQKGALNLEKYAADTGGDTYYGGDQLDLERLYSEVTEQARNEYTLTFSPQEVAKGQDFHPIEVRVKRPGLNVESRQGYYESAIAPGR
jgi:VWFA-related protein